MKTIVIGPSFENYKSASYQNDFMKELKRTCVNYYHYKDKDELSIESLLKRANFTPDVILYNHGWLLDDPNLKDIRYSKIINNVSNKNIKHVIFLNKEYSRIDEKLKEIDNYKFDLILTHLHNFDPINWTSVPAIFLPLAVNSIIIERLNNRNLNNRKYDLFFSGILQNWNFLELQNDLRKKIQSELFYCLFDFPLLKKIKYKDLNIYWKPFYKNRIKNLLSNFFHSKRLLEKEYFNVLSNSKCVLHTASPMGIISTRIFEALGAGAVGLFSEDSNANIIFKNNLDYLCFKSTKDLIKKIYLIKRSTPNSKYQKIANHGRQHVEDKHTWKSRLKNLKKKVQSM